MQLKTIAVAILLSVFSKTVFAHPKDSIDSVYTLINAEFDKADFADFNKIVATLNELPDERILQVLKNRGILAGEHRYDAEKLWQLHTAALSLGTHSNIALCLRRANKFQSDKQAKDRVKNEILAHLTVNNCKLPDWVNFNDLDIIENKHLGATNPEINKYFRAINTKFTDDIAWCAAYAGAKLKQFDADFTLPQYPFRAAVYGGFSDSGFSFRSISKKDKKKSGRYSSLPDLTYLPNGQTGRYRYTIDDFKSPEKVPFGAIVVFKRNGGGHVGFVVGTVRDEYMAGDQVVVREGIVILGGNQNDAVQFEIFYDLDKIHAVTMPTNFPKSDYGSIPQIQEFYDLPEFFERGKITHD